jgi:putative redox protein
MHIHLKRVNDTVLFEATNSRGHSILVEGSKAIGGQDIAPSPTELLVMSQAACTAIDIVELLKKMRQSLQHLEIESEAGRSSDQVPRLITQIHLHYKLFGEVDPAKAEKAISMSISKYCTVSKMIDGIARMTYSFEINPGLS